MMRDRPWLEPMLWGAEGWASSPRPCGHVGWDGWREWPAAWAAGSAAGAHRPAAAARVLHSACKRRPNQVAFVRPLVRAPAHLCPPPSQVEERGASVSTARPNNDGIVYFFERRHGL